MKLKSPTGLRLTLFLRHHRFLKKGPTGVGFQSWVNCPCPTAPNLTRSKRLGRRCDSISRMSTRAQLLHLSSVPSTPMAALAAIDITFLGTASAQPSASRNHSSLALRLGAEVWLFDCGEATQHQIQRSSDVRMGRIRKVFITHTHGDHIFGLAGLMASAMNGAGGVIDGEDERLKLEPESLPVSPPTRIPSERRTLILPRF